VLKDGAAQHGSGGIVSQQDALSELIPDAVIVLDAAGRVTGWNAGAAALYGWTREEAMGRPLSGLPGDGTLRRTRAGRPLRVRLRRASHGEATLEWSREAEGEAVSFRDIFEHAPVPLWILDVSRLLEMMAGLRAAGVADLSVHLDRHPAALAACMDAITVRDVNRATLDLFGAASAGEMVGQRVGRFWRLSPDSFRRAIQDRYAGRPFHAEETVLCGMQGQPVEVLHSTSFQPVFRQAGITLIGTLDIRDRKRAEAHLREVQAEISHAARVSLLGELGASIAHEVNQPLAAIIAYGQASLRWLDRAEPDLAELRHLSGSVVAQGRRAAEVIQRIRDLAAKREPRFGLLQLNAVVEEALLVVRHESASRAVRIETALGDGLPDVLADRVQLVQVVVNLAVNAIQAMAGQERERLISVATRIGEGGVEIMIEDTGPGIPAEHLERIFSGFFTTKPGGMGIGLSICHSILQAHGGRIAAENGRLGARFAVTLPAARGTDTFV
jgi:signal transduction histidine kinase